MKRVYRYVVAPFAAISAVLTLFVLGLALPASATTYNETTALGFQVCSANGSTVTLPYYPTSPTDNPFAFKCGNAVGVGFNPSGSSLGTFSVGDNPFAMFLTLDGQTGEGVGGTVSIILTPDPLGVTSPFDVTVPDCTTNPVAPGGVFFSLGTLPAGVYTITATVDGSTVTDPCNGNNQNGNTIYSTSTIDGVLTVDAPPAVGPISLPSSPVVIGTTVSGAAPFTDSTAGTHTAQWDWGDGSTSPGAVTEPSGNTPGSVTGTHLYSAPGVYTVSLCVTNADVQLSLPPGTLTGCDTFEYLVVYDPTAGFITGGGWIMSPAGAYLAQPGAVGTANFGFVSKYQKGATVPSGQTEFQFQTANLDFHSTAYQWLVITGQCRGQFKGTGTINGGGSYTFLLTGVDGEQCANPGPDTFEIQITDNSNNTVVYDNGTNQQISGGDIAIHAP
jgi:hypothetical protein